MNQPHLVVVGAGAIGASIASEARLRGYRVTVVEQESVAGAGCSHANGGLLAPSHGSPLTGWSNVVAGCKNMANPTGPFRLVPTWANLGWIPRFLTASIPQKVSRASEALRVLCQAGQVAHASLADAGLDSGYTPSGLLDVYVTLSEIRAAAEAMRQHPLHPRFQVLDTERLAQVTPGLQGYIGGICAVDDAYCDGGNYVAAIARKAARDGAEFRFNSTAIGLLRSGEKIIGVRTLQGDIRADHVIVSCGTSSKNLVKEIGLSLPLVSGTGYVVDLATGNSDPTQPIMLKNHMIALTPYPNKVRIAGILELAGESSRIDRRRVEAMVNAATAAWPALRGREVLQTWAGKRPCTADGLPIIGRSRNPGLSVATGHGQHGLVLAPVTAQIVVDQLSGKHGCPSGVDPWLVSPERFR